jgi:hypothetical protein
MQCMHARLTNECMPACSTNVCLRAYRLNYAAALRDVESDNGPFNAIIAMTAVQSAGLRVERNYGTWLLEKLLSKKSTSFNIGEGTLGLS